MQLQNWAIKDEGKKQKPKNLKFGKSKKERKQKRNFNHNESAGGDWKTKFRKQTMVENRLCQQWTLRINIIKPLSQLFLRLIAKLLFLIQ